MSGTSSNLIRDNIVKDAATGKQKNRPTSCPKNMG